MSGSWNQVSTKIVELVKENLSTPDQMIPYAERLFSALLNDIKKEFRGYDISIEDTENGAIITSSGNPGGEIVVNYIPDFYFNDDGVIINYNVFQDGNEIASEELPVSKGVETFDRFNKNLMQDIGDMIDAGTDVVTPKKVETSTELMTNFLYLNNYLPDNLRTDDPYKLIEVIRVLLDGSSRIRKVTEK